MQALQVLQWCDRGERLQQKHSQSQDLCAKSMQHSRTQQARHI
jgi:hypothetical protein